MKKNWHSNTWTINAGSFTWAQLSNWQTLGNKRHLFERKILVSIFSIWCKIIILCTMNCHTRKKSFFSAISFLFFFYGHSLENLSWKHANNTLLHIRACVWYPCTPYSCMDSLRHSCNHTSAYLTQHLFPVFCIVVKYNFVVRDVWRIKPFVMTAFRFSFFWLWVFMNTHEKFEVTRHPSRTFLACWAVKWAVRHYKVGISQLFLPFLDR